MRERAVVDDVDAAGIDAERVYELAPAVLRVDDDRVDALVQPALRARLAGPGLAREQIVRR